jgi:hypothetical protein
MGMELIGGGVFALGIGMSAWFYSGGPQAMFAERRKAAEANARAEEAKLEQKRLDRDRERS